MVEENGVTRSESREQGSAVGRAKLGILWVHPHASPRWTDLKGASSTIGRSPDADIVLGTEGASRLHARVARDDLLVTITDLGSRNGVYVDGERRAGAALAPGSVLRLGGTVGIVLDASGRTSHSFREHAPGL